MRETIGTFSEGSEGRQRPSGVLFAVFATNLSGSAGTLLVKSL